MNKYHAKPTYRNNIRFHSAKEAEYYTRLLSLEQAGVIHDLQLQVRFEIVVHGRKICVYIADFTYFDEEQHFHVIDTKGYRTPEYKLKKKLFEVLYPYRIEEV